MAASTLRGFGRLLISRRLGPLFVTQFLGAFHDNLFKNAFVVSLLFSRTAPTAPNPALLTALAAGVFVLPFVVFSAIGGQLADALPKERVMRGVKLAEIAIAALGITALAADSTVLSFLTLFALGTHSAIFGPAKYAILPQHLGAQALLAGNALINGGTFLAILSGTLAGTILMATSGGSLYIMILMIGVALAGYVAARFIPPAPPAQTALLLNPLTAMRQSLARVLEQKGQIRLCLLGIAWFWFLGATFLAQLPNYTHGVLQGSAFLLSALLATFSIGIALGSLLAHAFLKGRLTLTPIPWTLATIALISLDLYIARNGTLWHVFADMTLIAGAGGMLAVPLNAVLQNSLPDRERARILGGSAILNALAMTLSSGICAAMIAAGLGIAEIFLALGLVSGALGLMFARFMREPDPGSV